jgi:DNA topoisomerase-1
MEDDLDQIARGGADAEPWLSKFYWGTEGDADLPGLKALTSDIDVIDARAVNSIPLGDDPDGVPIVARVGRYGPYLQRGEDNAGIPEDLAPDELTVERALELLAAPSGDRELGVHPDAGLMVVVKAGRFGPYVQMGEHDDKTGEKPATASLFKYMEPSTLTLDDAVLLLSLPRVIGVDPADGGEITAQNGRYGPYIKKGTDSRTIDSEDLLLTMTLPEAEAIFAQPKMRRGQVAKPPLKDLGPDPDTAKPIIVKEGRFGLYVTDGETNASLRKGDSVEELTMERALELLADRRAAGPSKKKAAAKKAPAKKSPQRKSA